ncbi:unnamed protein product [Clonostachys byssicola]|uniref:Zn(2)-C6 fungal-type domain-containing protein n=1 Tax=Clonostachys byssicola TaxID=160290 RepID=A0A9N9Y4V4_9HYPO|nr:unnamed protein product [Clonostachys byssicola]
MSDEKRPKVLSCVSCRQRKIKCDKVAPVCTQCLGANTECEYPSRKPTRRAHRPRQSELLDRISRLENIVGKANPAKLKEVNAALASRAAPTQSTGKKTTADVPVPVTGPSPILEREIPTDIADTASRYLSVEFWGHLCEEVEGIKHALDEPSEADDDDDEADETSPESRETNYWDTAGNHPSGFLFGNPSYHERDQPSHPPRDMLLRLWSIYLRNVDPLMKFLHRPSLTEEIQIFANSSSRTISPSKHALLFCIYFAAVTSLSDEACFVQLGQRKSELASKYRIHAERALAAADYLANPNLTLVQAVTIYVTMLRSYELSRSVWVLTSMVVRLGQTLNLHRDGDGHNFPPFEAEMRRRLWYFIVVLDIRGAEDRGSDSILNKNSYNTILPTNLDDELFGPNMTGPIKPQPSPAENIFTICTARCSSTFGYIAHPQAAEVAASEKPLHTEEELINHVRSLEDAFIHTANPSNIVSVYASEVARIVILKLWLIVQYPFSAKSTIIPLRASRETMLRTAISVMELVEAMTSGFWADRFAWWTRGYMQWHPLAVALAELCIQTEGELADKAWTVIDRVFPTWKHSVADSSKGSLWRPIRKLHRKAKEARAGSMMKDLQIADAQPPQSAHIAQNNSGMGTLLPCHLEMDPKMSMDPAPTPGHTTTQDPNMDPSSLFDYLLEPTDLCFDQSLGNEMNFDMGPWNDFLDDTNKENSPDSGTGESTYS